MSQIVIFESKASEANKAVFRLWAKSPEELIPMARDIEDQLDKMFKSNWAFQRRLLKHPMLEKCFEVTESEQQAYRDTFYQLRQYTLARGYPDVTGHHTRVPVFDEYLLINSWEKAEDMMHPFEPPAGLNVVKLAQMCYIIKFIVAATARRMAPETLGLRVTWHYLLKWLYRQYDEAIHRLAAKEYDLPEEHVHRHHVDRLKYPFRGDWIDKLYQYFEDRDRLLKDGMLKRGYV